MQPLRYGLVTAVILGATVGLTAGLADVVQQTPELPPSQGQYDLPVVCIPAACIVGGNISGFKITSGMVSGGNEIVTTTATFAAGIFQNNGGTPGTELGQLSVMGDVDITYFGRDASTQLGTFNAQITNFDFAGTFNSHPFEFKQNPSQSSNGVTDISQIDPANPAAGFLVSSFFDVFGEVSLNNGPFVAGPVRHTTLESTPEPGTIWQALTAFLVLAAIGWAQPGSKRARVR